MKAAMLRFGMAVAGYLALAMPPYQAHAQNGAPDGAQLFKGNCAVCHSAEPGQNKIGPSLFGVVGRKAGTAPGYTYSDTMKNSGLTWTPDQLDTYLTNPKGVVSNTKMMFLGLKNANDRKAITEYLATLK